MPTHWTYDNEFDPSSDDDLAQGDILEPTSAIRGLFREVHPHFINPKYSAFIVLTQSCDLVRRENAECASPYVNLAVIRPLVQVLRNLLDKTCQRIAEGAYLAESKQKAHQLLQRVFNQNEQKLGVFYLHPDADVGIAEESVALLQVSVAVRAREHYHLLMSARTGRLDEPFQAKLGWLVGNLFSRVGTKDWESKTLDRMATACLSGEGTDSRPVWIPRACIEAARQDGVQPEQLSRDRISSLLDKYRPTPPKQAVVERVVEVVRGRDLGINDDDLAKLRSLLMNDGQLGQIIKRS